MKGDFNYYCDEFSRACRIASNWKDNFSGAAYITRIDEAYKLITNAYINACKADDEELTPDTEEDE